MMTFDMARKCKREGRKTVSTEDLFQSLQYLGKHLPDNAAKKWADAKIPHLYVSELCCSSSREHTLIDVLQVLLYSRLMSDFMYELAESRI